MWMLLLIRGRRIVGYRITDDEKEKEEQPLWIMRQRIEEKIGSQLIELDFFNNLI